MESPDVQPWDPVVEELLEIACETLAAHGSFVPFGAAITANGEVVHFVPDPDAEDDTDPEDDLGDLTRELAAEEYSTAVLFVDTRVALPGTGEHADAILIVVETRDGLASHTFIPYALDAAREITFGEQFEPEVPRPMIYGKLRE